MERINIYNEEIHQLLEEGTEKESWFWRYQDASYGGLIPINHKSYERTACDEEDAEYLEEGCSCYDNPYQLLDYMSNEMLDLDKTDVILFVGNYQGKGLDDEDIVLVEEESDIKYSMSLRVFYKFCCNADIYLFGDKNIKEYMEKYHTNYIKEIWSK